MSDWREKALARPGVREHIERIRAEWDAAEDVEEPPEEPEPARPRFRERLAKALENAADQLDALPPGGEALKGPYWYRYGVHDAANLLRDWADSETMLATLDKQEEQGS